MISTASIGDPSTGLPFCTDAGFAVSAAGFAVGAAGFAVGAAEFAVGAVRAGSDVKPWNESPAKDIVESSEIVQFIE